VTVHCYIMSCVESTSCDAGEFLCDSGECIFRLWTCDMDLDCEDGSDEHGCGIQFSFFVLYYDPTPNRRGHTAMMLSDVCLSVTYIRPKSRTERPRKTKIGTEVDHVTRDLDTFFKVKRSNVKDTRLLYSLRP